MIYYTHERDGFMGNYKPKEFAKMIGVSVKTLQRWDKDNVLKAYRTPKDRRYYTDEQYCNYTGQQIQRNGKPLFIQECLRISKKMISIIRWNF